MARVTAAERVAAAAAEGYMAEDYGPDEWLGVAAFLLDKGHSEHEAEAVMRSKHMRWADDSEGHGDGQATDAAAFIRYYEKRDAERNVFNARERQGFWKAEAGVLAEETPSNLPDPGDDILDGTATGFGTPEQRARWASSKQTKGTP